MTQTPDPREDALAKALEALALGRRWTTEHLGNCSEDDTPDEVSKIKEDLADIDDAIASLAALSAPPSQSESDDEKLVRAQDVIRYLTRDRDQLRADLARMKAANTAYVEFIRIIAARHTFGTVAKAKDILAEHDR